MKLIAKKHLHIQDDLAVRQGKRCRDVRVGEAFEVEDKEGKRLVQRGFAMTNEQVAAEEAAKEDALKSELGTKEGAAAAAAESTPAKPPAK